MNFRRRHRRPHHAGNSSLFSIAFGIGIGLIAAALLALGDRARPELSRL